MTSNWFVNMAYFIAAIVFIFGLKAMASPVTARKGVVWAGCAMIGATVATFFIPDLHNIGLMVVAIVLGGGVSEKLHKFSPMITAKAPVVAASFLNQAGIVGAALFAEESLARKK